MNFKGLAREAGYPRIYEFSDLTSWDLALNHLLKEEGPIFVDLRSSQERTTPKTSAASTASNPGMPSVAPYKIRERRVAARERR